MYEPVIILNSEHLGSKSQGISICDVEMWDIKNNILPLKTILNTEVIIYQDGNGDIKILKNFYGVTGTLLSNTILNQEGWYFNASQNHYQKKEQTITLKDGGKFFLTPASTSQPVLEVSTLFIHQKGHTTPLKRIATLDDLQDFFSPADFIIHDNYLNS